MLNQNTDNRCPVGEPWGGLSLSGRSATTLSIYAPFLAQRGLRVHFPLNTTFQNFGSLQWRERFLSVSRKEGKETHRIASYWVRRNETKTSDRTCSSLADAIREVRITDIVNIERFLCGAAGRSITQAGRLLPGILPLTVALSLLGTTDGPAESLKFSPTTHHYVVEFTKPSAGVSLIHCTFFALISQSHAEEFLREEIQRAVRFSPPTTEIMAYAWLQTSVTAGSEKMVMLADGSGFLIYSPKLSKTVTEKEYSAITMPPASGKAKEVVIEVVLNRQLDGKGKVLGKTNLPDEMTLMVDLRNKASNFFAQNSVTVRNGIFETASFSDRGRALGKGLFEISISSPLSEFQPSSVKAIIGKQGENLAGSLVETNFGSKTIWFSTGVDLQ